MTKTKELTEEEKWQDRPEAEETAQALKILAVFRDTAKKRGFRIEEIKLTAMGSGNEY